VYLKIIGTFLHIQVRVGWMVDKHREAGTLVPVVCKYYKLSCKVIAYFGLGHSRILIFSIVNLMFILHNQNTFLEAVFLNLY
jgi:hypothetical protein